MILALHIAVALASIGFSSFVLFRPTDNRIKGSYGLIGGTIVTGTLLVLTTQASILRACVTGLGYVAVATGLTFAAQKRLASVEAEK